MSVWFGWKLLCGVCRNEVSSCALRCCQVLTISPMDMVYIWCRIQPYIPFSSVPQQNWKAELVMSILRSLGNSQYSHCACKSWKLILLEVSYLGNLLFLLFTHVFISLHVVHILSYLSMSFMYVSSIF